MRNHASHEICSWNYLWGPGAECQLDGMMVMALGEKFWNYKVGYHSVWQINYISLCKDY